MKLEEYYKLPARIQDAILDTWMNIEMATFDSPIEWVKTIMHSKECEDCRNHLVARLHVFITRNVTVELLVEHGLIPSQANPWLN